MRSNDTEEITSRRLELDCVVCDHETVAIGEAAVCPNCDRSYSITVRDGFALMEREGWTIRVTFEVPEELSGAVGPTGSG